MNNSRRYALPGAAGNSRAGREELHHRSKRCGEDDDANRSTIQVRLRVVPASGELLYDKQMHYSLPKHEGHRPPTAKKINEVVNLLRAYQILLARAT